MYVCSKNIYPSNEVYKWSFGDLPQEILEICDRKIYMRDLLTDIKPFIYNKDTDEVRYSDQFDNDSKEYFKPEHKHFLDGNSFASLTNWTPQMEPKFKTVTNPSFEGEADDRIDALVDTELWKFQS